MPKITIMVWGLAGVSLLFQGCGSAGLNPPPDGGTGKDGSTQTDQGKPDQVWGWISVIEPNDVCDAGWNMITTWLGGVRSYFAASPTYPRALPHHLGFLKLVESDGSCQLYERADLAALEEVGDCFAAFDAAFECWRDCSEDQQCEKGEVSDPGIGTCQNLPAHWSAGSITLAGLKQAVAMTPNALDQYRAEAADDLFDEGDEITATTSGGELAALSLTARGVAPLEPAAGDRFTITLEKGNPVTLAWKKGTLDARVQVQVGLGSHDPNPLVKALLCDAPDSDGQIVITASLVDQFLTNTCGDMAGKVAQKCSRITRYTRDVKTPYGKEIELFVGSARNLNVLWY
jgi:hypothetical protein